jgi:hypothetical protein
VAGQMGNRAGAAGEGRMKIKRDNREQIVRDETYTRHEEGQEGNRARRDRC